MRSALRRPDRVDLVAGGAARLLRADGAVARVRPWPGEADTVHLVTVDRRDPPSREALGAWLAELAAWGVTTVRTGALGPGAVGGYREAGFAVRQELALLTHSLVDVPGRPGHRLRRPRRHDLLALALIDRRAFGPVWGLDPAGLVDACQATPAHRLRVATEPGRDPAGFAVSGRAGRQAYLQRLAVDPAVQGTGLGRALVVDALRWARRQRAKGVLVNTHVGNDAALALYRSTGFEELAYRLAVMERALA